MDGIYSTYPPRGISKSATTAINAFAVLEPNLDFVVAEGTLEAAYTSSLCYIIGCWRDQNGPPGSGCYDVGLSTGSFTTQAFSDDKLGI